MSTPKRNIVLTGFMGTGKTAVGRELSRVLSLRLVDIDEEIEKDRRMKIREIFEEFGEPYFRDIETATIRRLAQEANLVISTGGGAVLREENMEALREKGMVFCLAATPETIYRRTVGSDERPLLNSEDPMGRIRALIEVRTPFYEKAGIMIDTEGKTPVQIAEEIVEIWRRRD